MRTRKLKSFVTGLLVYAMLVTLVACSSNKANSTSGNATSSAPVVASSESTVDAAAEVSRLAAEQAAREEEERKAAEEEAARQAAEEEARRQAEEEERQRQEEARLAFNEKILDVDYMREEIVAIAEDLGYVLGDEGRSEVDGTYLFWLYPPTDDDNGHLATLVALCEHENYLNYMSCTTWLNMDFGENGRDVFTLEELRDYLDRYALFKDDRMQQWQENEAATSSVNDQLLDMDYMMEILSNHAGQFGYTSVESETDQDGNVSLWAYAPDNDHGFVGVRVRIHDGSDIYHSGPNNYCDMIAWFDEEEPIWYIREVFTPQDVLKYIEDYSAVFK